MAHSLPLRNLNLDASLKWPSFHNTVSSVDWWKDVYKFWSKFWKSVASGHASLPQNLAHFLLIRSDATLLIPPLASLLQYCWWSGICADIQIGWNLMPMPETDFVKQTDEQLVSVTQQSVAQSWIFLKDGYSRHSTEWKHKPPERLDLWSVSSGILKNKPFLYSVLFY